MAALYGAHETTTAVLGNQRFLGNTVANTCQEIANRSCQSACCQESAQ